MFKVTMTEVLPPCACLPLEATRAERLLIAQPHPTRGASSRGGDTWRHDCELNRRAAAARRYAGVEDLGDRARPLS